MLFNPEWNQSTGKPKVADVFSLASLIAWLETMPADKAYDYMECKGGCLLGQYFTGMGFVKVKVGGTYFCANDETRSLSDDFRSVAVNCPHTFGAALSRALACEGRR